MDDGSEVGGGRAAGYSAAAPATVTFNTVDRIGQVRHDHPVGRLQVRAAQDQQSVAAVGAGLPEPLPSTLFMRSPSSTNTRSVP